MQSNCQANQIQVAESTAQMLMGSAGYRLKKRGIVNVKGKGDVNTYLLNEGDQQQPDIISTSLRPPSPDKPQS
jgi:hypothetical protein